MDGSESGVGVKVGWRVGVVVVWLKVGVKLGVG